MANALYTHGEAGLLAGTFSWAGPDISAALVLATYTPDLATDTTVSDLGAHIATMSSASAAVALTSLTTTGGVAGADDVTFPSVDTGQTIGYVVIYDATSHRLIACIDTATGIPLTSTGDDVFVVWDTGPDLIFSI